MNRKVNVTQRRRNADIQNIARKNRSVLEQISELDIRLGKGIGAVKERTRLNEQISKKVQKKEVSVKSPSGSKKKFKKGKENERNRS
ncbi:MAG: hypothetical protein J7L15_09440 [Clostridiales bacterium]|nr:hypothetical protein [Clostridiales bacterium]